MELVSPEPTMGSGAVESGVRPARRDHGAKSAAGARSLQLQCPRHREHGGVDTIRHRRAPAAMVEATAGWDDPLGVRHDRTGGGQLGCDQYRDAYGTRW